MSQVHFQSSQEEEFFILELKDARRPVEFRFLSLEDVLSWFCHLKDKCGAKFSKTTMTLETNDFETWLEKATSVTFADEEDCEFKLVMPDRDIYFYFHTKEQRDGWVMKNLKFMAKIPNSDIQVMMTK